MPTTEKDMTHIFVNSDWSGNSKHRQLISGMGIFFTGAPVVYRSIFQSTISLNSTEAEFMAAAEAGNCTLYLRSMLDDLRISQIDPKYLYKDNEADISMANA